jgi:hypothetical protein
MPVSTVGVRPRFSDRPAAGPPAPCHDFTSDHSHFDIRITLGCARQVDRGVD